MMSGIRGTNTGPEIKVRKGLFARGFRYRINDRNLPGKPDIVLPKYRAVVLVNGCFWHGHDCHLFRIPSTRREFWEAKINRNRDRDQEVREMLFEASWRQYVVWECALKGKHRLDFDSVMNRLAHWLRDESVYGEISGLTPEARAGNGATYRDSDS